MRLVHLGLGSFFRAHQAWYTDRAPDGDAYGIAAFEGRGSGLAKLLADQDGLYTLVTRAADGDRFEVVGSVSRAHAAADHDSWLGYLASPATCAVTVTVTEAGYLYRPGSGLDTDRDDVTADLAALRREPTAVVRTAPARLVAGLAARRRADAGPVALVPCDNLPDNGAVLGRVVRELAGMVDPALAAWIEDSVSCVTTMVDRITPRTVPEDLAAVPAATGVADACPVVTEPFSEWVLSGQFPAGRPQWEAAGATFTDDVTPFGQRKLWLLNGGHSIMAYAGSLRGHHTVAEAFADDTVRSWLETWWGEAAPGIGLPGPDTTAYLGALRQRFANPRLRHLLSQIAVDGSQKLPVRVLPTLRAFRVAGRVPPGATLMLGAWVAYLRSGVPVDDVKAATVVPLAGGPLPEAVRRVLAWLDPGTGADDEVNAAVRAAVGQLSR